MHEIIIKMDWQKVKHFYLMAAMVFLTLVLLSNYFEIP